MKVVLSLEESLSEKEIKTFKIPNTLEITDFHGAQYAMCLGAIYKDNYNNYKYVPEYSKGYIDTDITPNKLISFCELHKNIIIKDRIYVNRHFADIYYIKYVRQEKPMVLNDYRYFSYNELDIELILNENGFYNINDIHIKISPNSSILRTIEILFSNENIKALPFITIHDNQYYVSYYDDYGKEKIYRYDDLKQIFDRIVSVKLTGCKEVIETNE